MLLHRQTIGSGAVSQVFRENLVVSACERLDDPPVFEDTTDLNEVELCSGNLIRYMSSCNLARRNLRIVVTERSVVKFDYGFGQFIFSDKITDVVFGRFRRTPPPGTHIACSCASELSDGMFFYSYAPVNGTEDLGGQGSHFHAVYAVLMGEDRVTMPVQFSTVYKGSGFADKPAGRIVSLQCHPTQQLLFVVYSQGQVQVWSYTKCLQQLQLVLAKMTGDVGGGGAGGGGFGDADETGTVTDGGDAADPDREDGEDGDNASEGDGASAPALVDDAASAAGSATAGEEGPRRPSLTGRKPSFSLPGPTTVAHAGSTGSLTPTKMRPKAILRLSRNSKQQQLAQSLRAVAAFVLPTRAQLSRLDPEYAQLAQRPSSFRLDSRGRYAAVVWSERIVCVYDLSPLPALCAQLRASASGTSGQAHQAPVSAAPLSVFGAFPCRALPTAAGTEYAFGPVAFHPRTQVLLVTVLRHRLAARSNACPSSCPPVRLPLSPLLCAVSLRVHHPILSALGCYDVGPDVDPAAFCSGSLNWRPLSLDCTPHTGMVVLGLQVTAAPGLGCGGILDDAPPIGDVTADLSVSLPAWRAAAQADDDADFAVLTTGGRPDTGRTAGGSAVLYLTHCFSEAWLRRVGAGYLAQPLFSPLPVPPDSFQYGEGVLSTRAAFLHSPPKAAAPALGGALSRTPACPFILTDKGPSTPSPAEAEGELSDLYPLLLALRPAVDSAEDGRGSAGVPSSSYHIFRTHWAFPSLRPAAATGKAAEGASATYVGKVPALLKTALLEASKDQSGAWLRLQGSEHDLSLAAWGNDSDALLTADAQVTHTLHPGQLLTLESVGMHSLRPGSGPGSGSGSGRVAGWDALLLGVVQRSVASRAAHSVGECAEVNAAAADRTLPCVVFLRNQPGPTATTALAAAYTNLRAAAFWVRPASGIAATARAAPSVLALSRSGRQLLHLEYQPDSTPSGSGDAASAFASADPFASSGAGADSGAGGAPSLVQTAAWDLGTAMTGLWTGPGGGIVLASQEVAGAVQTVYALPGTASAADFAALGVQRSGTSTGTAPSTAGTLPLVVGEILLEAAWQPVPSALQAAEESGREICRALSADETAALQSQQRLWLALSGQPLLALRTSHRVLLCTAQLGILNEVVYVEHPARGSSSCAGSAGAESATGAFLRRLHSATQRAALSSAAADRAWSVCRDRVVGVVWVGAALCCTYESGAVHYLLVGPTTARPTDHCGAAASPVLRAMSLRARAPGRARSLSPAGSVGAPMDDSRGVLCCLPRNLSTTMPGSLRVVAVLSDRLLLSYLRCDDGAQGSLAAPLVAFTQRPLNPLEPLALGLVALERLFPSGGTGADRRDVLASLLGHYTSPRVEGPAAPGAGARPSAQATRRLVLALASLPPLLHTGALQGAGKAPQHSEPLSGAALAVFAAGVQSQQDKVATAGEFPSIRWVPSGFKHRAQVRAGLHKLAALELLSVRAELQELLLDSEAYGGAVLPHPHRALSARLCAAALMLFVQAATAPGTGSSVAAAPAPALAAFRELCAQQKALAQRLLDVAGDYSTLVAVLASEKGADRAVRSAAAATAEEVPRVGRARYLALQSCLRRLKDSGFVDDLPVAAVSEVMQFVLQVRAGVSALGDSGRLRSLTAGGALLALPDAASPQGALLQDLEARQREHSQRCGGQQGPPIVQLAPGAFASALAATSGSLPVLGPRAAGLLAMDLLEDWMGVNTQLELASTSADELFGGGPGGDQTGAGASGAEAAAAGGLYMGQPLPASWVEGVGAGAKEHEVLSGYWRFSDAAYAGEPGFHSCTLHPSGARLVFLDLSRFNGAGLELYCAEQGAMRVEYSTSPVDPGEKHDNVKSLCDVVYCDVGGDPAARGLRCPVPRGSQLDIGLYHSSAQRSKLTAELVVGLDDATDSLGGGRHVLLQRRVYREVGDSGVGEGEQPLWTLFLSADGAVCFSLGGGDGAVLASPPGTMPLSKPERERSGGSWTHIAVVLDASKAAVTVSNGTATQGAVSVALFVRGEVVAQGKLTPPSVVLSSLESTMLHVGPGLAAGWRLTELRVWADKREASDLEGQRDNYLTMAMKRKRLQLRVKGTKRLFTAFRDIEVPEQAASAVLMPILGDADGGVDEAEGAVGSPNGTAVGVAAKKMFATPLLGKKPALAAPFAAPGAAHKAPQRAAEGSGPAAGASVGGAAPAGGGSGVASAAPASGGPAPAPAPAPPAAPMTARERRLQQLKAGAAAAGAVNAFAAGAQKADLTPTPVPASEAQEVPAAPAASIGPKTSKVSFAAFESPGAGIAPSQCPLPPAPSALKKVQPSAVNTASGAEVVARLGTLGSFGLRPASASATAECYSAAKPFATPLCWAECRRAGAQGASATASNEGLGLQSLALPAGDETSTETSPTPFSCLPQQVLTSADSAICTPLTGKAPLTRYRVAVLTGKTLQVYTTPVEAGTAELVAQMSMGAVRLAHWVFLSPDMLLVVSTTSGFTIRVTPPPTLEAAPPVYAPKPVKIFDRCDLTDLARWDERVVYDLQVSASDGWTMLTTGPRTSDATRTATASASQEEKGSEGVLVSLYHAKTGLAVSFHAHAGCFRAGMQQALLAWRDGGGGSEEPVWAVTALDLAAVQAHWRGQAEGGATTATALPAGVTNKLWRSPIDLAQLEPWPLLAPLWRIRLQGPGSSAPQRGDPGDRVAAAVLDLTTSPAAPSLRVVARGTGELLAVSLKPFSQALAAGAGAAALIAATSTATRPAPGVGACTVALSPPLHVWSVGSLVYVLTQRGLLHQCRLSGAAPQYVGAAPLLLPAGPTA